MSVLGVLGIIFIVLKVLGIGAVAAWSWWLVLLPLYGGLLLWLGFILLFAVLAAITN